MFSENTEKIPLDNKPSKKPLIGVLLILLSILVYSFYTRGVVAKVNDNSVKITEKSQQISELKAKLETLEKAEKELKLSTEVQRIESLKAVPTSIEQDEIIRDLIEISGQNTIKLNSISFSKGNISQDGVGSVRVNASFEGSYTDLIGFLTGLEQNARIFKVDSIGVQLSKIDLNDIEKANFNLAIDTFFQK